MSVESAMEVYEEEHDRELRRGGTEREATRAGLTAVLETKQELDIADQLGNL